MSSALRRSVVVRGRGQNEQMRGGDWRAGKVFAGVVIVKVHLL
jgi:hypothetical protein